MSNLSNLKSSYFKAFVSLDVYNFSTNLLPLWNYLHMETSATGGERSHKQTSRNEVWKAWGQLRGGKKQRERRERKHSWPYVCSYAVQLVASQFCWPPLHAPSPHHSPACLDAQQPPPTPSALLLLLPKQPHYDCVSSEWPATSYLSAGMDSFMSAGHRFNTRPVGGMTGGLAGWWTACLSVEVVLLPDWMPFWRCWGHRREMNQNVLLGNIPGC